MNYRACALMTVCVLMGSGCVSKWTHKQTLGELEKSRQASAQATAEADGLTKQLETTQQELSGVKKALDDANTRVAALEKKQEQVNGIVTEARDKARDLETKLSAHQTKVATLTTALEGEQERLKAEEAERARLEQERAAKEAEIQRLTQTHADLTKSLKAEIAKGDIKIKQVRDRLTINMVDRVLFDSGQAKVKPAGLKVLKQVSKILKKVTDKQIRIEGHTDNVPISMRLKGRVPTNWELSTARATIVVRYLIEEGSVDPANLSAVGYADTRPIAGNDTEEGRTANRRIEIVLYPKDLSEIASKMKL